MCQTKPGFLEVPWGGLRVHSPVLWRRTAPCTCTLQATGKGFCFPSTTFPRGPPQLQLPTLEQMGGCQHADGCGGGTSSWAPPVTPGPLWDENRSPWCHPRGQRCREVLGHTAPCPTPALTCRLAAHKSRGAYLSLPAGEGHGVGVGAMGHGRACRGTSWTTMEGSNAHFRARGKARKYSSGRPPSLFSAPWCLLGSPD